jgi:hypothetical protein
MIVVVVDRDFFRPRHQRFTTKDRKLPVACCLLPAACCISPLAASAPGKNLAFSDWRPGVLAIHEF